MAKIVIPQTSPFLQDVQSPRLTNLPTAEETYANLISGISDGLIKFSLEERKREDELKLAENPIKKSVVESFEENLNSYVYDDNGSINYEQSLIKSENILMASDTLYEKTKADVIRKYEDMGLSKSVLSAVRSSVAGQFNEDAKSIKQAILQQQSALKIGYIDELKLDFTEDENANIEISFEKIGHIVNSIVINQDKSKQRAELIQFARSAIQEKSITLSGALQIINGFESDTLNKAVKDVRGVSNSFATIKNEMTYGFTKEELTDDKQDFIPINDVVFEKFKEFSIQLPDSHPNKERSEAIVNIFQDDLNRQERLEEINVLIQEGRIEEATQMGKLMSPTVQGAYFGKLMSNISPSNPDQVRAFANVINYFTDLRSQLPKEIKQQVENFVLLSSFPTNEEKTLLRSLYQKRDRLILDKDATEVLRTFSGSFEPDGQPALIPAPDEATISRRTTAQSGEATETFNNDAVGVILQGMGKLDLGDSYLRGWLPNAMSGNENVFETDHKKAKDRLNVSVQDYLAQGQTLSEASSNAINDFQRDNLFVTINGKVRLLQNYSLQNLRDSSNNPISAEDFSVILEQKLYEALSSRGGADKESIQEQMDELVESEFFLSTDRSRQLIFFTNKDSNLTSVTIDANEIAKDFATNSYFVDTKELLTLFDENPEFLTTNAGQALQTPMPSSQEQVRQANSYLGYSRRTSRKFGDPIFGEEDLKYYVDNYPFKNEDPEYLEFVKDLNPLLQIEVLRARTKNIIGMATGEKFITHPYTRSLYEEIFNAALESYQFKDPADALQKLVNARADRGEEVGFWEEYAANMSDLFEETFDFVTETVGAKSDQPDLLRNHKEITDWLKTGKTTEHLSNEARSAFFAISKKSLEMTKESYQLQINALKTNEDRKAFFEENIRKPIELDNYRFSGVKSPSDAILLIKRGDATWVKKSDQIQRAFNMMKKTMAENPRGVADRYFVSDELNIFLGADSYLRNANLKPSAEAMVSEQLIPKDLKGRSILSYINQENPSLDENQIVDLLRFNLAEYFTGIEVDPEYAFAFDKGSILKILNSLRSNNE